MASLRSHTACEHQDFNVAAAVLLAQKEKQCFPCTPGESLDSIELKIGNVCVVSDVHFQASSKAGPLLLSDLASSGRCVCFSLGESVCTAFGSRIPVSGVVLSQLSERLCCPP